MLDGLRDGFAKIRTMRYAIILGLVLTFVVCTILLLYASYLLCFGILLVALAGYYIPYLFGLRSKKKLAVWGIVLILLLSIPYTINVVNGQNSSEFKTLGTVDGSMVNGTVTPFRGDSSTVHRYSILVTDSSYSEIRVIIYDSWAGHEERNTTMTGTAANGGTLYTYETTLQNRTEYGYWFLAYDGQKWVSTSASNYGPMHVSDVDLFVHWLPLLVLSLFIQVGLLYFLLLALGYWTDRSKAKIAEARKQKGTSVILPPAASGTEEKFICSECGAEVPGGADKCPQCGERFDEGEEQNKPSGVKEKVECSDCGAAVDEDALSCWNCGKEFEN